MHYNLWLLVVGNVVKQEHYGDENTNHGDILIESLTSQAAPVLLKALDHILTVAKNKKRKRKIS